MAKISNSRNLPHRVAHPSQSFNLTGDELDVNDTDKKKSTGVLYPAAQLAIDKEGQLQIVSIKTRGNWLTFSIGKERPG